MKIPKDLKAAIESSPPPQPPEDKLDRIRALARDARDLEASVKDAEQRLSELKSRLRTLYESEIIDLMDEVGIDRIGVPARGNLPAFDLVISTDYQANIAAGWDEQRRREAFDWLEEHGHGDLIKTEVTFAFPRGKVEEARELAELAAKKFGAVGDIKEAVPPPTMKSWFKEMATKHLPLPSFEVIGARIQRLAKPRERKS